MASIKVFDGDGNEIGQCSTYEVKSNSSQSTQNSGDKFDPKVDITLTLQDWKTPVVPMPPPVDPQERKAATATIGLLVWMLGGRIEISTKDIISVMDEKVVRQLRLGDNPDKMVIEVRDK